MAKHSLTLEERFLQKVDKSGDCWLWTGKLHDNGHGAIVNERKQLSAHRVAWEQVHGTIPQLFDVRHSCASLSCVRVEHLFLCKKGRRFSTLEDVAQRFWAKVDKTWDCWLWKAGVNNTGYGILGVRRKGWLAHRFSWEMENGPVPTGLMVLHHCDTPACVRPDHLFIGTQLDNMRDASKKGRVVHGEEHSRAKLSENAVRSIRLDSATGMTFSAIGKKHGVRPAAIAKVINGTNWRHVA